MITVVITIVVILILALVAFGSSGDVMDNTDYSKFVNNLSEVGYAFDNASVDIQGSSMLVNNKKRDEQIYNYIAKGGQKEKDFLIMSKVPDYTIIQESAEIGMDLPEMKIESGTGRMVAVKYVTTKTGEIFIWPPYEYGGKLYITETDTVDHKMQTNISVGGKDFEIELDPEWGSIIDKVIEETETPEPDYDEPSEEGHEHDFSAKEATAEYFYAEATCTTSEKYYYKCLYCEEKGTNTYNWGNPLDHSYGEFVVVTEGNCGGAGSKKRVCSRCNNSEIVTIPKNSANHIGGEISEMKVVASCSTAGIEEIKCKTCNVVFRTNNLDKDPNNHAGNIKVETTKDPTCTTVGTQVERCTACNKTLKTENIDALGHSWGDYTITTPANCVTEGVKERTCSSCKIKETDKLEKDLSNHTGGTTLKETVNATCTSEGSIISKCSLCKTILDTEKIAAKGHNFTSKTATEKYLKTKATCIAAAEYYFKCSVCDASAKASATPDSYTYANGDVDKTNHVGEEEEHYTAPTSTTDGRRWTTCSACGEELSSEVIPCTGAVAVYSDDDKSLRFYKNADTIVEGSQYRGRTVTALYENFENNTGVSQTYLWHGKKDEIKSVYVEDEISPLVVQNWFRDLRKVETMDLRKLDTSNVNSLTNMFFYTGYDAQKLTIHASGWNTENVTSMISTFDLAGYNSKEVFIDISGWNTKNVEITTAMFNCCGNVAKKFEIRGLDTWDTSSLTGAADMFFQTGGLAENWTIGDLSKKEIINSDGSKYVAWNTSKLKTAFEMFRGTGIYSETWSIGDISTWNVSSLESASYMFENVGRFSTNIELDLSSWDTSNIKNMTAMFKNAGYGATNLKIDISNWDTSLVTNMSYMFNGTGGISQSAIIIGLNDFDTENVTDMSYMFADSGFTTLTVETQLIGDLDSDGVIGSMDREMLRRALLTNVELDKKIADINFDGNINTTDVVRLNAYILNKIDIPEIKAPLKWNTSKVTNMTSMFQNTKLKVLDLGRFDTSSVTTMTNMFEGMKYLERVNLGKGFSFLGTNCYLPVPSNEYILVADGYWYNAENGVQYTPTAIPNNTEATYITSQMEVILAPNITWFDQGGTIINRNQISSITIADTYEVAGKTIVDQWDASTSSQGKCDNVGPVTAYVEDDGLGNGTYKLTIAGNGTGKVYANPDSSMVFGMKTSQSGDAFINMTSFDGEEILDTSRATTFLGMFTYAKSLESIEINEWNVSNVISTRQMFGGNESLTEIDLSNWNTSNLTNMRAMFQNCIKLTNVDISNFDTSKVTDMGYLFNGCRSLIEIDTSGFNTSKVTNMMAMFQSCIKLTNVDISDFDTSKVTDMGYLFTNCESLVEIDVSDWDTSKVTNMGAMFSNCSNLENIDVSNWDVSSVTQMYYMFSLCDALTEIDLSSFDTAAVVNMGRIFCNSINLEKIYVSDKWSIEQLLDEIFITADGKVFKNNGEIFVSCYKLVGGAGTAYATTHLDYSTNTVDTIYAHIDEGPSNPGYLTHISMKEEPMLAPNSTWYSQGGTTINRNQISSITIADTYEVAGKTIVDQWDASASSTGVNDDIGPVTAYIEDDGLGKGTYKLTLVGNGSGKVYANPDSSYVFGMKTEQSGDAFINMTALNGAEMFDTSRALTLEGAVLYARVLESINTSNWDTSKVMNMSGMFAECNKLTSINVENWNTSNVAAMTFMFSECNKLTIIGVGNWNTSNVIDMSYMFAECNELASIDVTNWDTSKVTSMTYMFADCDALTSIGVGNWNTSNVKDMSYIFVECNKLKNINVANWDTSKVINMSYMFAECDALTTIGVGNWNTSSAVDMSYMFAECDEMIELDVAPKTVTLNGKTYTAWDTSKVQTFKKMFALDFNSLKGKITKLEVENWNTSACKDMHAMFMGCSSLTKLDLSKWNVSNVMDMTLMFADCINITEYDFSGWDTSSVTTFFRMFDNSNKVEELDLSSFDTSHVTNAGQMFFECTELKKIYVSEKWDLSNLSDETYSLDSIPVTGSKYNMFWNCNKLTGGAGTAYAITRVDYSTNYKDYIYARIDEGSSNPGYLTDIDMKNEPVLAANSTWYSQGGTTINRNQISSITIADSYNTTGKTVVDQWDASQISKGASDNIGPVTAYIEDDGLGNGTYKLTLAGNGSGKVYANPDSFVAFGMRTAERGDAFVNMTSFNGGEIFDLSRATTTKAMFVYAQSLQNINVSNWNMSNVTDMSHMFNNNQSILEIDVSNWNTSNVTTIRTMFQNCFKLTDIDVGNWDVSKVTDMGYVFNHAESLTEIDVSNWDTSKVTNMLAMFQGCYDLINIDVSEWNVSKVTDFDYLFCNCESLEEIDVSNWDTSNVTNMGAVFSSCRSLKNIDLTKWNTSKVTKMYYMFYDNENLKELNLSSFDTSSVVNMGRMFDSCRSLEKIYVSEKWTVDNVSDEDCKAGEDYCKANEMIFGYCYKLVGGAGTAFVDNRLDYTVNPADYIYAHIDEGPSNPGYLTYLGKQEVPGLGDVTISDPDAEITYDPDTGNLGGEVPPLEDEPEPTPDEIPETKLPEMIAVKYGKFESNTTYTPGTYEDVTYEQSYTRNKYPVTYGNTYWSQWKITKDDDGNVISTEPGDIKLENIEKTYSTWIVYDFETEKYLESNGVKGDTVEIWTIYNSSEDTLENAVYLAAYLNKLDGKTSRHIAKHNGTNYVEYDADSQISAVTTFTETYVVTGTKRVEITKPSSTTNYVYIPVGELRAEKGMTWAKWLESEYNTTGETTPTIKTSDFADVAYTDVIDETKEYGFIVYELSGVWTWNEEINYTKDIEQMVDFQTTEGLVCNGIRIYKVTDNSPKGYAILIDYHENHDGTLLDWDNKYEDNYWYSEASKYIDFGDTPQSVSQEFYEWFTANATEKKIN